MSFSEWSNNKKKKQQEEQNQKRKHNTQAILGNKTSFSDWSNNKLSSRVDENYINSFISDANSFFSSAEADYNGIKWDNASSVYDSKYSVWTDLNSRKNVLSTWLESNKRRLSEDWYNKFSSMLNDFDNGSTSIINTFKGAKDHYSQFETEKQYEDWEIGWLQPDAETSSDTVNLRKIRYADNKTRLREIDRQIEALKKEGMTGGYYSHREGYTVGQKYKKQDEINALTAEKETLQAENTRYEREQKTLDDYFVPETDEFLANGADRNYSNPTKDELRVFDENRLNNEEKIDYFDGEYYRDAAGNIIEYSDDPGIQDKLGFFLSATDEEITEAYNRTALTNGNYTDTWADLIREGDINGWKFLDKNEINIYYDLLKREGQAAAYEFLDKMTVTLTKRATQAQTDYINSTSGWEQVALNVASIPMNVFGGVAGFIDDASNIIQGEDINPYSRAHMLSNASSDIREKTTNDINEATGNTSLPWLGTTWGDAYQAIMSVGDAALGVAIGSGAYSVMMGMGAASQEMKHLYEIGASADQMIAGGLLAGAAEMVFEKFSIDKFLSIESPQAKRQILKNFFMQGGIEASEEMATEIANTITNAIVMGSQSDWVNAETFVKSVLNAGLSGFISGGVMGGGASAISYARASSIGKAIKNSGYASEVFYASSLSIEGMHTNELFSEYVTKGINEQNITNAQLGTLYVSAKSEANRILSSTKAPTKQKNAAKNILNGLAIVEKSANTTMKANGEIANAVNVDGGQNTGYNDSNINQNNGGSVNDEADTRGYREDRNRKNTSNRGRQGSRKNSWAEDKAGFIRRTKGSGKNGKQRVIVESKKGKTLFAYTPAEPDNSPAYKAVAYLNDLGIKTVYCDGVMESNDGTVTYTHPEATTGSDGIIYVNKNSSISSEGIAVHEGTHHYERANSEEYITLKTVIKSNLDTDSRAYIEFVKEIRNEYFANIPTQKLNKDKLKQTVARELVAYTNQFITTRPDAARIHFAPMFKNWGEVVRATMVFNKAIGLDFVSHGAELQSFKTNGKIETNSIFNEPNMSRATERIGNLEGSPETQVHRNIIDIAERLDLELEIGEDDADLNGVAEGARLHMSYGTQTPIRYIMTQALKEFARYSPNFTAFEKIIKETDNLQKWFSGEISNQQDNVLEFAAEALFDDDTGLRKLLAVAVSKDKKASKFVPDFMKDIKKKLADYPGIVEVLDEIQYTFSEASYDARHRRADNPHDVFYDNYSKDESFWKADNKNKSNRSVTTLKDKFTALFGKNEDDNTAPSISEIVKLIEKTFGIPVSSGKFRHKAYGIYRQKSEAIRTKVANALPTIAHELGHHLDKKHNLSRLTSIDEAIDILKQQRPDFISSYAPRKHPNEAVAEFVRIYLADRAQAKYMYPKFFSEFEAALSENGADELNNIRTIGDKINSYFTADKAERARAAVLTRAEARKINLRGIRLSDVLEKLNIQLLDDGAALKKISDESYNLYYFAKKSSVRAKNTISGYYMSGFDGDLVEMRDKNGSVIKDNDGKPQYVKALKYVLDGIDTAEQRKAFDDYLVYRHGIYWVENDLRVFADDSINNKEYMQSEIKKLEKQYPKFKETAENLYDWYRTFIYEYGIKSGLLTKEQYKNMTDKYPCYVPFMRNVEKLDRGVKSGTANQSAPIRNAKGSGLEILSPVENIVIKVEQFMKAADRNAIMQEIADVADTAEGKGYLLEQVPPSMVPVTVSVKTEPGDIIDEAITETITEFRVSDNQGVNVVRVYRNGEKTYYQVHDPNLLVAITGMNKTQYHWLVKSVGFATRIFKTLTTSGNAVWSLTSNAPRDFLDGFLYGSENNPAKYAIDYIKAVKSAIASNYLGDKHADEIIKMYKALGGGFNNSLSNSARELKVTVREAFAKDGNLIKRITANYNFIEMIEKLTDSIETAPRLAEFKRVYEKTGDRKRALSAAEEITVNFNRSGVSTKFADQFIPYLNASLQGDRKFIKALGDSIKTGGDKSFIVKLLVCSIILPGIEFMFNNLLMGNDENDEYEKLSSYKKNSFWNFFIGDGKFISIPKSKNTVVFANSFERIMEIAMKEDTDYSKEVEDFLAYLWLAFGIPLLDDTIGVSTALELAKNETFTGAPIVSSYYEDLVPEMQYNEKTTYLARLLGKLRGWSPMKIDHVINSNLGVFGLLNKSVGRPDPDFSLGLMTKFVTDNTYSTDTMNNFYTKAEEYSSLSKSYPDDTDALYNDELYSSVRSIISELNQYGKEDESAARDYRILANDYAVNYIDEIAADGKLITLLERTNNADILPYKTFNADYSIDKVKYRMDSDTFVDYVEEYYSEISQEYRYILRMGYSDETTAAMLIDAKKDVDKYVSKKHKVAQ